MNKLMGKVAVVTGGGRGIGRAISLALANEGAEVVVNYLSHKESAEEVVNKARAMNFDQNAVAVQGDVSIKADAENVINTAIKHFGKVDILVNNAGVCEPAMITKMTEDQWDRVVNVQLKGPFLCTQAVSKHMIERESGRIINIASPEGWLGTKGQANYSSAKGGVIALTRSSARELGCHGITVNAVQPGYVNTQMMERIKSDPKLNEIYMRRILMGRFAEPEEIAPIFVFLASRDADYITGQVFCVDGGLGLT